MFAYSVFAVIIGFNVKGHGTTPSCSRDWGFAVYAISFLKTKGKKRRFSPLKINEFRAF